MFNGKEFETVDQEFGGEIGVYERLLNYVKIFTRKEIKELYTKVLVMIMGGL